MGAVSSKLISLQEAASVIPDGSSIVCPSFGYEKVAFAFLRELMRQRKKNLYLYGSGMNVDADMLIGAGCVSKAEIGYIGFENIGLAPSFRRAVEQGKLQVEDYSNFIMTMGFMAGALGIPFQPIRSGLGSDIMRHANPSRLREIQCPFTGEKLAIVRAIEPDFAIIHAQRVDTSGNVSIEGLRYDNVEKAKAAKTLIVTCEEITDVALTRTMPEKTIIPGFLVDYVVEVPFGAHPYGCYRYYDYDWEHIEEYYNKARTEEGLASYLDTFVYSVSSHEEYLERIGLRRLLQLRANASTGYSTFYEKLA